MGDIFVALYKFIESAQIRIGGYSIIRVTIREDENYGRALIQGPSGMISTYDWDESRREWS